MQAVFRRDQNRPHHLRHEMRRRDETDVVTASFLQFEHHFSQTLVRDLVFLLRFPRLRDLIILTINASEIAVAEKDIAGAVCSR